MLKVHEFIKEFTKEEIIQASYRTCKGTKRNKEELEKMIDYLHSYQESDSKKYSNYIVAPNKVNKRIKLEVIYVEKLDDKLNSYVIESDKLIPSEFASFGILTSLQMIEELKKEPVDLAAIVVNKLFVAKENASTFVNQYLKQINKGDFAGLDLPVLQTIKEHSKELDLEVEEPTLEMIEKFEKEQAEFMLKEKQRKGAL